MERREKSNRGQAVIALEILCLDISALTSCPYLSKDTNKERLLRAVSKRHEAADARTALPSRALSVWSCWVPR